MKSVPNKNRKEGVGGRRFWVVTSDQEELANWALYTERYWLVDMRGTLEYPQNNFYG